jgi:hypothetical protein
MTEAKLLLTPNVVKDLIERLGPIPSVRRLDQPGEPQSATIAHSLSDMERSFRRTLDTLLPRLLDRSLTTEGLSDALLDIGEELRHILYHIHDPKYFDYLLKDIGD